MKKRLLIIAGIAILILLFTHPIEEDGDFFQHVNIGRYIAVHHTLPRVDDLTFTALGRQYIGYAWLSGLLFYSIYSAVGAIGINILVLSVALLTFYLLFLYLRRLHVSTHYSLLTILLIAPLVATRWPSRPEIFVIPIVLLILLVDIWRVNRPRIVLLHPVLMLLLVTLYGSSFPLIAGIFVLLSINNWLKGERGALYYGSILLSFLIASLNGYGFSSLFFIALIPKMTFLWTDWIGFIDILTKPYGANFSTPIIVIYFLLLLYVFVLAGFSHKKMRSHWFFVVLAVSILAPLVAVRQRALSAILAAPLIGLFLSTIPYKSRWLIPVGIFVSGVSAVLFISTNVPAVGGNESVFPPGIIRFVKMNNLTGNVFNTPRIGSFLSYNLAPSVKVFSDTRDDLFIGTGVLETTGAFLGSQASPAFLLHKYHIDMVIVSLDDGKSFRDLLYDDDWSLVYYQGGYLVFIPKRIARQKNMRTLDRVDPYVPSGVKTIQL